MLEGQATNLCSQKNLFDAIAFLPFKFNEKDFKFRYNTFPCGPVVQLGLRQRPYTA